MLTHSFGAIIQLCLFNNINFYKGKTMKNIATLLKIAVLGAFVLTLVSTSVQAGYYSCTDDGQVKVCVYHPSY